MISYDTSKHKMALCDRWLAVGTVARIVRLRSSVGVPVR